jgi:hypothetical protein
LANRCSVLVDRQNNPPVKYFLSKDYFSGVSLPINYSFVKELDHEHFTIIFPFHHFHFLRQDEILAK